MEIKIDDYIYNQDFYNVLSKFEFDIEPVSDELVGRQVPDMEIEFVLDEAK